MSRLNHAVQIFEMNYITAGVFLFTQTPHPFCTRQEVPGR
jgi:hypothetical protein